MDLPTSSQPMVLDLGSGLLKTGFAGEELPRCTLPCVVGRPKHRRVMAAGALAETECVVGRAAVEQGTRGLLHLTYPMENGQITNWEDMERVWEHVFRHELQVTPSEHPILLTESPLNPWKHRERLCEVFFERFHAPGLYVTLQALLSLYASGRTTGLVLDVGDSVTQVVPVYEGFACEHAIGRTSLAGRAVTDRLQWHLRRAGYQMLTSAERDIVRDCKERFAYVAFDPEREESASISGVNSSANKSPSGVKDDGKSGVGSAEEKRSESGKADASSHRTSEYRLPDGQRLILGPERFRAAEEVLFHPHRVGSEEPGVPDLLVNCVRACDVDLRQSLYQNIVLSGGTSLLRGFGDRLLSELKNRVPKDVRLRITAPPDRRYSTWIGGSILASLATMKKMWITQSDWKEYGPSIVHRRSL